MALPKSLCDREQDKFEELNGETAVRITGSVNNFPTSAAPTLNIFSSVSSVASGTPTTVVTYTVPATKTFYLAFIEYSGTNIATYRVYKDASLEGRRRGYIGTSLEGLIPYNGFEFLAGEVVKLEVEHDRTETGDFDGRIVGSLV